LTGPIRIQEVSKASIFASLIYPDFRRLWTGTLFFQSGVWALIVARAALSLELTSSLAWAGNVTFAAMIPSFLLSPFGGYLADRYDRRSLLIMAFSLALAVNLLLAILVAGGAIRDTGDIWYLLTLSILHGCIRALQFPSTQSLLPNLIPKTRLLNAVALNQTAQQGARMIGPMLMVPLIFVVGPYWAFFVSPILFLLAITQAVRIKTISISTQTEGKTVIFNLMAGIKYMYSQPIIFSLVLLTVCHCAFTMAFESLLPMFGRDQLGMTMGSSLYSGASYLMAGVGIGAVTATLALARVRSLKSQGWILFLAGLFSGLTPIGLAVAPNLSLAILATAFMGASTATFMAVSNATIQSIVPDNLRGRIMGINMLHIVGAMAVFNLVNGHLGDISWISAPTILIASGLVFTAIVAGSVLSMPLREIYSNGAPVRTSAP
jgi:MFS family permease